MHNGPKKSKTAGILKWIETNKVKINGTRQYNIHILDKTIFLK